ncbi:hypothetical protein BGZ65_002212 [Modicella reniformis]|uniref:Uncharacterized protein n=1 Tax=Modicella reniformis TaxID=1440133 RepID=A0A9P6MIK3_9FUNG|nr:hypothetical protein BGZ65_002212 [Modicella reniformis]
MLSLNYLTLILLILKQTLILMFLNLLLMFRLENLNQALLNPIQFLILTLALMFLNLILMSQMSLILIQHLI